VGDARDGGVGASGEKAGCKGDRISRVLEGVFQKVVSALNLSPDSSCRAVLNPLVICFKFDQN
jgi:hypothetical protein